MYLVGGILVFLLHYKCKRPWGTVDKNSCFLRSVKIITMAAPGPQRSLCNDGSVKVNHQEDERELYASFSREANWSYAIISQLFWERNDTCNLVRDDIPAIQIWRLLVTWNDKWLILQVLRFNVSYQKETCHLERKNKMKSELLELQNCIPSCLKAQSSYSASVLKHLTLRNLFEIEE